MQNKYIHKATTPYLKCCQSYIKSHEWHHLPSTIRSILASDIETHNRQLQTLSSWHAAGLGLPLMIIWRLHNRALQLSRTQTSKWQQPPSSSSCPDLLLSATCRWSASLLCHLTHWTPDTELPQEQRGRLAATYFQWIIPVSTRDVRSDIPHLHAFIFKHQSRYCWVSYKTILQEKLLSCFKEPE